MRRLGRRDAARRSTRATRSTRTPRRSAACSPRTSRPATCSYRDRALAVFDAARRGVLRRGRAHLHARRPAPVDDVEYTPLRFALLQSALRDMYELVATRPGGEALEPVLEERIGAARTSSCSTAGTIATRTGIVDWPDECVNVVDGLPRGGLQMAERTLTGEIGSFEEHAAARARRARRRRIASTTACPRSTTRSCRRRSPTRSRSTSRGAMRRRVLAHRAGRLRAAAARRRAARRTPPATPIARALVVDRADRATARRSTSSTPTPTRSRSSTRAARTLAAEILLAPARRPSTRTARYTPAVMPRALALSPDGAHALRHRRALRACSTRSTSRRGTITLDRRSAASRSACVVVGRRRVVFVACSQDDTVVRGRRARRCAVAAHGDGRRRAVGARAGRRDGSLLATQFLGPRRRRDRSDAR